MKHKTDDERGVYATEQEDSLNNARAMMGWDKPIEIEDDSDLKKYRIELPNLYDDADLDPYEFRLLVHYKRVGSCTESTRTTATNCKMSPGQVSAKRKVLCKKGWIKMAKVPISEKEYSYRITVVDKWQENFQKYGNRSPHEHPRSPHERKNYEDDDFSKVITYWQNTHTFLIPTHANLIGCMLDEWREHADRLPAGHKDKGLRPADVLIKAIDITAKKARNPHSLAYLDKVVKNFIQMGIDAPKPNGNGSIPLPEPRMPDLDDFERKYA